MYISLFLTILMPVLPKGLLTVANSVKCLPTLTTVLTTKVKLHRNWKLYVCPSKALSACVMFRLDLTFVYQLLKTAKLTGEKVESKLSPDSLSIF